MRVKLAVVSGLGLVALLVSVAWIGRSSSSSFFAVLGATLGTLPLPPSDDGEELPLPPPPVRGFPRQLYDTFPQLHMCNTSWMQEYSGLHSQIVTGNSTPRYFISVAVEAGTADRLSGLITQLYIAFLSKRALTLLNYPPLPPWECACDSFTNLTHPLTVPDKYLDVMKFSYNKLGTRVINSSLYRAEYWVNRNIALMIQKQPWDKFPEEVPDIPYVLGASNRGRSYDLIKKSRFSDYMQQQMGLTPETGFLCGFSFICSPNAQVQKLYQHYWDALRNPNALKISINIRVGDKAFRPKKSEQDKIRYKENVLKKAGYFWECAKQLEANFSRPGQEVLWYVMSDSLEVRQDAQAQFGSKVITDANSSYAHPDCRAKDNATCATSTMNLALQHAIGQLWTFSLGDIHLVTGYSGFGTLGAWISGKPNRTWRITFGSECEQFPVPRASNSWAGV